jgi:hypothetical protein
LPAELSQAVSKAATDEGISKSEKIRRILTEHLKAKGYLK